MKHFSLIQHQQQWQRFMTACILLVAATHGLWAQVKLHYGDSIDEGYGASNTIITPYVTFGSKILKPYQGCNITRVRIGLNKPATNVYLYFKANDHDSKPIYKQPIGSLPAGWNDIVLNTPFTINTIDNIAIGYRASFAEADGAGYSKEQYDGQGKVYQNSSQTWTSVAGSFNIEAYLEGDNLPSNQVRMGSVAGQNAEYGVYTMPFSGVVYNSGVNSISSYELEWTVDNNTHRQLIETEMAVNGRDTFTVDITSQEPGEHAINFHITKVNGVHDSFDDDNSASAILLIKDPVFRRRVLCEEVSGLWCGFCPRGMVGMELMKEMYPDNFIPVSIHWNDVLQPDTTTGNGFQNFYKSFAGAPGCLIDRQISGDPYFNIKEMTKYEQQYDAPLAVDGTATWNEDQTAITVNGTFFSSADISNAAYRMAFELTEDSVWASKEKNGVADYPQANYYNDGRNGYMYGWETRTNPTIDFCFMHLARGVYGSYEGEPCYEGNLKAMEKQSFSYSFTLPATVINKRHLNVVGLIIDANTGFVANAFSTKPHTANRIGIQTMDAQTSQLVTYRLYSSNGQLLKMGLYRDEMNFWESELRNLSSRKSIYLVRLSNGKTMKITR